MHLKKHFVFLFVIFFSCSAWSQQKTIHFVNGQWFNGQSFIEGEFYSVNGVFTKKAPATIDTTVDLGHQYIIPPFGEAHNHSPDAEEDIDVIIERYLSDGIFYIKNPNSIPYTTKQIAGKINHPHSVDVVYANGGLTATGGYPTGLYAYMLTTIYKKMIPRWTNKSMEGEAYYIINNKADVDKKWPFIMADKPGFLKVYLLYSEEYKLRKNDTLFNNKKGLDPKLIRYIVKKAKRAGLTVSCNAETPADVLHAARAGVNEINHLPGYQIRWEDGYSAEYYLLTPAIAKLMRKKKIHADATYSLCETEIITPDTTASRQQREVQIRNLLLLKKQNISVTVACDSYNLTSKKEIEYLQKLGVYTNAELLKMWCETTPLAIFPNRKIARLQEGYEASFLVLQNNPLENHKALFQIALRVKQGHLLW